MMIGVNVPHRFRDRGLLSHLAEADSAHHTVI